MQYSECWFTMYAAMKLKTHTCSYLSGYVLGSHCQNFLDVDKLEFGHTYTHIYIHQIDKIY